MRAIFPASFDPITNGHLDIATRASRLFDDLVIAVYDTPAKALLFSLEERVALARASTAHLPNVRVEEYSGLTVEFARRVGARVIVRGLRAASDFDWEYLQATANHELAPELEIVLLMSHSKWSFISSTLIKEIVQLGGDVSTGSAGVDRAAGVMWRDRNVIGPEVRNLFEAGTQDALHCVEQRRKTAGKPQLVIDKGEHRQPARRFHALHGLLHQVT